MVLALVLSRAFDDDSSGWGDLIGVLVGMVFGAGLGLALVLVGVGTALRRAIRERVLAAVLALPSALLVSIVAGVSQIDFWLAYAVYLGVSMCVVWWYSGRAATA